jgi:hypothetical protein
LSLVVVAVQITVLEQQEIVMMELVEQVED